MQRFVRRHQLTDTERAQAHADGQQIRIAVQTEADEQAAARNRILAAAADDPGTCGTRTQPRS